MKDVGLFLKTEMNEEVEERERETSTGGSMVNYTNWQTGIFKNYTQMF